MGGARSTFWERTVACRIFVGGTEGRRPHGRPSRRGEDIVKIDHQEMSLGED